MKKCVDRQKEEQYIKPIGKIGNKNRENTLRRKNHVYREISTEKCHVYDG